MTNRGKEKSIAARPLALVTGASSGIGEGFARRLARDGYDLILVARRKERLEALADELRNEHAAEVEVLRADLTDDAQLGVVSERIKACDRLTLLINNAGFMTPKTFADADACVWDAMVRVHALATTRLARAALPGMIARGKGDLINVASIASFMPMRRNVVYTASKMFLVALTEGLHQELHGTGVRVQALCPGWTRTELVSDDALDTSAISSWSNVDDVVNYSLRCLERGKLIAIPGWRNRMLIRLSQLTWRPILRWLLRHSERDQVKMKGQ